MLPTAIVACCGPLSDEEFGGGEAKSDGGQVEPARCAGAVEPMAVQAAVGFEELLAGWGVAGYVCSGTADAERADMSDDLPDFAAVYRKARHGGAWDAFGDEAKEAFVVGGVAEGAVGEIGPQAPPLPSIPWQLAHWD